MPKPLPTPQEYRSLPKKDRMNKLTRLFFWKASETPMFVNNKISPDFCRVRTFFSKTPELTCNLIYDYLYAIERTPMDMSQLFVNMVRWNTDQRFINSTPVENLEQYESISEILKRDLGIDF